VDVVTPLDTTSPNPSRAFCSSDRSELPVTTVPVPHFLAHKWRPKIYIAANGREADSARTRMFYTLHKKENYREIYSPYLQSEPDEWEADNHPTFREPDSSDELHLFSKGGYGVESLTRMLPMSHPLRLKRVMVYSCTTSLLMTPELDISANPNLLDSFLKHRLGKIMCPVCLFNCHRDGSYAESTWTRGDFIAHYRSKHQPNLPVLGLGFSTGYHNRMYQAMAIYMMAYSKASEQTKDDPTQPAMVEVSAGFTYAHRPELKRMLEAAGQQVTIQRLANNPTFGQVRAQGQRNEAGPSDAATELIDLESQWGFEAQPLPPLQWPMTPSSPTMVREVSRRMELRRMIPSQRIC